MISTTSLFGEGLISKCLLTAIDTGTNCRTVTFPLDHVRGIPTSLRPAYTYNYKLYVIGQPTLYTKSVTGFNILILCSHYNEIYESNKLIKAFSFLLTREYSSTFDLA